jgi:hypothetical protein
MTDLQTQMRKYLEETSLPVDVDELMSELTNAGHTVQPIELAPVRRTRPRPVVVVVVASLLTLLVIGAFGITGLINGGDPDVINSPPTVVTTLPVTTVTTATTEGTVITSDNGGISPTHTIQPGGWVAGLTIYEDTLWAVVDQGSSGQVLRVDPATGDVLSSIDLLGTNLLTPAIEAGEGALWVAWSKGLFRIDPVTENVETIVDTLVGATEMYGRLAVGEGAVWLLDNQSSLIRIDPTSNTVSHTIELEGKPWSVEVGAGSVWVLVEAEPDPTDDPIASSGRVPRYGRLLRIDPETLEVTSSTTISDMLLPGVAGKALGFGEGALWITEMGYLTRIDPDSNSIVASILVPGTGCGPLAIGFGGGKVWTTKAGHPGPSLVAIDPGTNEATAAVWIQEPEGGGGSIFNITGTDDAIWVTRMASLLQRVSITDIPPGETTAATPCA